MVWILLIRRLTLFLSFSSHKISSHLLDINALALYKNPALHMKLRTCLVYFPFPTMASSLQTYVFPVLLFVFFLVKTITSASGHSHHHNHNHNQIKSIHFALYQHETINKTGYIIVNGVAGPGVTQTTTPFGTLFAFQDPLTVASRRSSKVIGIAEGTSITSSFDGLRSISVAKITLRLKNHIGSISIVGGTHNLKASDHPVVGGTGDFIFVQGYITSSPVDLKGLSVVYKIEFHLYWPPYAKQASLS